MQLYYTNIILINYNLLDAATVLAGIRSVELTVGRLAEGYRENSIIRRPIEWFKL